MPREVTEALTAHGAFRHVDQWAAEPEAKLRFDDLRGEPRNSDLLVDAHDSLGAFLVAVEAKADEPFSETVADALAAALERRLQNSRTNGITRIEQLATALLGPQRRGDPALKDIRYQLLTACAGVLCEAERRGMDRAVLLVHEFFTDKTVDQKHAANARDLDRFLVRLSHGAVQSAEPGRLYGPFAASGPPLFSTKVKLFIGKVTRSLRVVRAPKSTDYPGYLGCTSQGVLLIHADWPAYAVEHGWKYSLVTLGQFPHGTTFKAIDYIDQCYLFAVGGLREGDDKFDAPLFHVALWHEDVLELLNLGYLLGRSGLMHRDWAELRANELKAMFSQKTDGTFALIPLPSASDFDDAEAVRGLVSSNGVTVTDSGFAALESALVDEKLTIDPSIRERTVGLFLTRHYDAAIRETCVLIEDRLRKVTSSSQHGQKLIDEFFARAFDSNQLISAQLKAFQTEVRTAFKFVRNEYAHNLRELSRAECYAILVRMSAVYSGIGKIAALLRDGES